MSETKLKTSVYSDILTKLRNLHEMSQKQEYYRDVLNDGAKYITELIVLIEEQKDNTMDQETTSTIKNGFQKFMQDLVRINTKDLFTNDLAYTKETFYSYMNIFNLSAMKNYFQRSEMQKSIKILYGEFLSLIFSVISSTVTHCKFTVVDLEEPRNNREILQLMLNYMKAELDSDSSLPYSTTTKLILNFLWIYSDKTVVVPNLIEVGYSQAFLKWLEVLHM